MSWNVLEEEAKQALQNAVALAGGKIEITNKNFSEPPKISMGDLSTNIAFAISKQLKKPPKEIAQQLANTVDLNNTMFSKAEATPNGYVNFFLDYDKAKMLISPAIDDKTWGDTDANSEKILVEYSSPNIAKPMSVGHFRATVLGDSIYRIYKSQGYEVITDNHIGDFGTQFGKLIIAIDKWGDKKKIEKQPINQLLDLYVKFHDEAETDKTLEDQARDKTKQLEDDIIHGKNDSELYKTWEWAKTLSLQEFDKTYEKLGSHFDLTLGESYFAPMMEDTVKEAIKEKITKKQDDGSIILNLEPHGLPNTILLRKDGGSVYITRDIPCFKYREKELNINKIIYVVGKEQELQFKQLFKTMQLLGYKTDATHISFGHFRLKEGKMSTRKGTLVRADDLINEVIQKAEQTIKEKSPKITATKRKQLAETIGIGALKFSTLQQSKQKDIIFDKEKMISFEGDTGPYVQYAHVRCNSILEKTKSKPELNATLENDAEKTLIKTIIKFPETITHAANNNDTHEIAQYLLKLTSDFNAFYRDSPVLKAKPKLLKQRIALVTATKNTIKNGLYLLGINAPDKM